MINLEKMRQLILETAPVLGRESVPLLDALNRVLIEDIVVAEDHPAADISALDGYALRHADLQGASRRNPESFRIIGESPAGNPCGAEVAEGDAVRVMTGGLIPEGADTVVKLEDTIEKGGYVLCCHDPGFGCGIRLQGDSLKKGTPILRSGDIITPVEVGALASMRRAFVCVHRKPLVAILATGDELADFHEPSSPAKAMCSNLYALAAQVLEAGATPLCLGVVQDDLQALQARLQEALCADIVITSGGTSRGKYDMTNKAFAALGIEMRFSNIFQKPGKPTILGTLNGRMVFGLPGNPSATMLSFTQFIRPVIFKMMGHRTGSKAACSQSNYFAFIDSFNYRQGGNPGHQRASQVPLSGTLSENDGHRPKQIPPGKLKADCQKVVAH